MHHKVGIAVPFRDMGDARRHSIWCWNRYRLNLLEDQYDAVVRVGSAYNYDEFNRSAAINEAVDKLISSHHVDYVVVLDADTIFNPVVLTAGLLALREGAPWVLPYDTYFRTDKDSADRILSSSFGIVLKKDDYSYTHVFEHPPTIYNEVVSGLMLVSRGGWQEVGGFNEDFRGWGYEDRGWQAAADVILGPYERLQGSIYHLWHPESHETTEGQPHFQENRSLYEHMRSITDPLDMKMVNRSL